MSRTGGLVYVQCALLTSGSRGRIGVEETFLSYLHRAKELALEAGTALKREIGRDRRVEYKGEIDLVTDADRLAESILIDGLRHSFPDHAILAEESGKHKVEGATHLWIVDPLDGTTNYAHQYPFFCVSIALELEGKLTLAVVYDPMLDETFTAIDGEGAFLNGHRIKVTREQDLAKSFLSTGFPYDLRETEQDNLDHFLKFMKSTQAVRRDGSAVLDLCYVACGRFDGFWEMKLSPWDVAAGALVVQEAGGKTTSFHGGPLDSYTGEVVASNGGIHEQMLEVLRS
jgi:myo-inositol-1(or 4)-monophosphatase